MSTRERWKPTAQIQERTTSGKLPPVVAGKIGVHLDVASCEGDRRGSPIPALRKQIEDGIQVSRQIIREVSRLEVGLLHRLELTLQDTFYRFTLVS
jgi:hypothetical protein